MNRSMTEHTKQPSFVVEESHYQLLRLLEQEPHLSQRELAKQLGISLGKVNYCIRALAEKGWIKAGNFYRSSNKRAYLYILTPRGVVEKAKLTLRFLRRKEAEHRALINDIEALRKEVRKQGAYTELSGTEL